MIFIFLTSGLFLGWSLGANDAANVFGTAVGSKMLRFKTAAIITSVFVIIGAVIGGAGASHTLGKLGAVNAIAGSFIVALSAGFTVFWMTKLSLPVSTSQAIVGSIMGWNLFSGMMTDYNSLTKIISTWVICPLLAAVFAMLLYYLFRYTINNLNIHLLDMDIYSRVGLVLVGAFGAYSLGANNIANVMGVFVPAAPFEDLNLGFFVLTGTQQLFMLGGIAIAVGVFTYSHRVMETVGGSLLKISPVAALVVVLSESLVLFLFSSQGLERWLINHGLPSIPLVPVSSSQAVVGAVIGIGIIKGGKNIRFKVLGEIATGWISTPITAAIITFISLFIFQNVFDQQVYEKITYKIDHNVIEYLHKKQIDSDGLVVLENIEFESAIRLHEKLRSVTDFDEKTCKTIIRAARIDRLRIDPQVVYDKISEDWLGKERYLSLLKIQGKRFQHAWQLIEALQQTDESWQFKEKTAANNFYNKTLKEQIDFLITVFRIRAEHQ
jgi:PiT family inorganic phosphate transporter